MLVGVFVLAMMAAGCGGGSSADRSASTVRMGSGATGSVVTSTSATSTTTGPTVPPPTGNTRADFVTAIAQTFRRTVPASIVADDQVNCVAEASVDAISVPAFTSRGLTAAQVAAPAFSYAQLGMDRTVADQVVGAYKSCGVDKRSLVRVALAAVLDAEQSACVDARVDEAFASDVLADLLMYGTIAPATSVQVRSISRDCRIKLR